MNQIWLYPYADYFVGVDLGQVSDYTAISIVEEPVWIADESWQFEMFAPRIGWVSPAEMVPAQVQRARACAQNYGRPAHPPLELRHLERMRHVGYPKIVDRVAELLARPPLSTSRVRLLVDHGGVGRAVVDQMEQRGLHPIGVTITGGDKVNKEPHGNGLRVPKREIVSATQIALQTGRLKVAEGLGLAPTLVKELLAFRVKISAAGHDSYEGREGEHDDLVLSAGLAVWYREWWSYHYDKANAQAGRVSA